MKKSSNGMGFFSWLGLAFIVLKLTGYISWSWWLVLSPIWVSVLIVIILVLISLTR